jgi:hypothetical protein
MSRMGQGCPFFPLLFNVLEFFARAIGKRKKNNKGTYRNKEAKLSPAADDNIYLLVGLGFDLRALHLQSRCSIA